jgi:hypothetical protein
VFHVRTKQRDIDLWLTSSGRGAATWLHLVRLSARLSCFYLTVSVALPILLWALPERSLPVTTIR